MKKLFYLFLLAPVLFIVACGEAGVESDISKVTEISFTINANDLNDRTPVYETESINFAADEFEEFIGDAKKFTLNNLTVEMSGLGSDVEPDLQLYLDVDVNNTADPDDGTKLLSLSKSIFNGKRIVLFDKDGGGAALDANNEVVRTLETAILNGEIVQVGISAVTIGDLLTEDLVLTFYWDLTARVQLD